jgi:hypothetical protein
MHPSGHFTTQPAKPAEPGGAVEAGEAVLWRCARLRLHAAIELAAGCTGAWGAGDGGPNCWVGVEPGGPN